MFDEYDEQEESKIDSITHAHKLTHLSPPPPQSMKIVFRFHCFMVVIVRLSLFSCEINKLKSSELQAKRLTLGSCCFDLPKSGINGKEVLVDLRLSGINAQMVLDIDVGEKRLKFG